MQNSDSGLDSVGFVSSRANDITVVSCQMLSRVAEQVLGLDERPKKLDDGDCEEVGEGEMVSTRFSKQISRRAWITHN